MIPMPKRGCSRMSNCTPGKRRPITARRNSDEVLAVQERARELVVGPAEGEGREGRAVEGGAQSPGGQQHESDEERRPGFLLSFRGGAPHRRRRGSDRRVSPRSQR